MKRLASLFLAYFFLLLAIIGVFLPGLPTVPFLLLAAWFASKGSKRLHRWLYTHPRFGQLLIDWEKQGAISRKSKVLALLMLVASWLLMYRLLDDIRLLTGIAVLFFIVALYLISRPEPS